MILPSDSDWISSDDWIRPDPIGPGIGFIDLGRPGYHTLNYIGLLPIEEKLNVYYT